MATQKTKQDLSQNEVSKLESLKQNLEQLLGQLKKQQQVEAIFEEWTKRKQALQQELQNKYRLRGEEIATEIANVDAHLAKLKELREQENEASIPQKVQEESNLGKHGTIARNSIQLTESLYSVFSIQFDLSTVT
ncbi:hypothetical protein RFI_19265, partial [Reticulomyxa filosa]